MADIYIKNKHGIAHSIPESMLGQVKKQGGTKISKAEFDKLAKPAAEAKAKKDAKPTA